MKLAFDPQIVVSRISSDQKDSTEKIDRKGLEQLCQDFESLFISSLFRQMRQTIPDEEGIFGRSSDMDLYQDMMDTEIAREMARKGGLGLGRSMYDYFRNKLDLEKE